MSVQANERTDALIQTRRRHPAWQLLASHRAPLVLSCFAQLFAATAQGVRFEDALHALSTLLHQHTRNREFAIADVDHLAQARRELRTWIKRALIVERDGDLYAADALEAALRFVEGLEERILTSTGSRLSLVQNGIEWFEEQLNSDPEGRASQERRRIEELQQELTDIEAGCMKVLSDAEVIEGIRDIFRLATDLKADFRRVEQSWREHGMRLRQCVVNAGNHRDGVVDCLLDSNARLPDTPDTPEGRAFDSFHQQLACRVEIKNMHSASDRSWARRLAADPDGEATRRVEMAGAATDSRITSRLASAHPHRARCPWIPAYRSRARPSSRRCVAQRVFRRGLEAQLGPRYPARRQPLAPARLCALWHPAARATPIYIATR